VSKPTNKDNPNDDHESTNGSDTAKTASQTDGGITDEALALFDYQVPDDTQETKTEETTAREEEEVEEDNERLTSTTGATNNANDNTNDDNTTRDIGDTTGRSRTLLINNPY
jgi:hypothetical protein